MTQSKRLESRLMRLEQTAGVTSVPPVTALYTVAYPDLDQRAHDERGQSVERLEIACVHFADGRAAIHLDRTEDEREIQFLSRIKEAEALRNEV